MPNLGFPEIMVIVLVALIVFGPKRLPEISRQVGGALRELRKVQSSVKQELSDALNIDEHAAPSSPPRVAGAEADLGEPDWPTETPPSPSEPPSHGSFN